MRDLHSVSAARRRSTIVTMALCLVGHGFSHDKKTARSAFLSRCRSRELSPLRSSSDFKARGTRKLPNEIPPRQLKGNS